MTAPAAWARGADFSAYQDNVQLQAAINHGLTFAMVKTTEGDSYVSPRARLEIGRLESNGVVVGLYHFVTHDVDGASQWDHFETTLGWTIGKLAGPVAVDHERDSSGVVPSDAVVRAFIARGHQRGYRVGRYGSADVFSRNLGEDWRWVARWAATPPAVTGWKLWQFAAGRGGAPDWDVFPGTPAQARAWATGARLKRKPKPVRWWFTDPLTKAAKGPYRLAALAPALLAYLIRHPKSGRLEVARK